MILNILKFCFLGIILYYFIAIIAKLLFNSNEFIGIKYSSFSISGSSNYGMNILIRLFAPCIYVVIISGILYNFQKNELVNNIYLITIFYYLYRIFIILFVLKRKELQNWTYEIVVAIVGSMITIFVYNSFIIKTTEIFIPIDELRNNIWFSIILFFFIIIRDCIYNIQSDFDKDEERKRNFFMKEYFQFKSKYYNLIPMNNKIVAYLAYSIMIVENLNRPKIFRMFEYLKFLIRGDATIGIMQVKSNKIISDEKSIEIGYNKILNSYKKYFNQEDEQYIRKIILDYNDDTDYANDVEYIFNLFMENDSKGVL